MLVVLVSLGLTLYLVFRTTGVQTFVARVSAHYLSQKLQTVVRIGGLDISLRHGLVAENICMLDDRHDTMFAARRLGVRPDLLRSSASALRISRVFVDRGNIQLMMPAGDSLLNIEVLIEKLSGPDTVTPADTTPSGPFGITVASVMIRETRFHYRDGNEPAIPFGMNYGDIDVKDINLDIHGIEIDGDTIRARINALSAREKSGFVVHSFSGDFQVSPAFLKADDLRIITPHSDLDFTFRFIYDGWPSYIDFLRKISIHASIRPSILDMTDIGFFAPEIRQMQNRFRLSGRIDGTVANFKAEGLRFNFGETSSFAGDIAATGLPDIYETYADLRIDELRVNKQDIETFRIPADPPVIELPEVLEQPGEMIIRGNFAGFYNHFSASLSVRSGIGNVVTDLLVTRPAGHGLISYTGKLRAQLKDAGALAGSPGLPGFTSFTTTLEGKGLSFREAEIRMNLKIDSVIANHYNYHDINIRGELIRQRFNGSVTVDDPCLRLAFNGMTDFTDTIPEFDFNAKISHADLRRLHLSERDTVMTLSATLDVNFTGNDLDNLDGYIRIGNTLYREGEKEITMDQFSLYTARDEMEHTKSYHLSSDFAEADISGNFRFTGIVSSLSVFIRNYLASFTMQDSLMSEYQPAGQVMACHVLLKDTREVTGIFIPFLTIAEGTTIRGEYNEKKPGLTLQCRSPMLTVSGVEITGYALDAETGQDMLTVKTSGDKVYFKRKSESDSTEILIENFMMAAKMHHDSVAYDFYWEDKMIPSSFGGYASFSAYPRIDIHLDEFDLAVDRRRWSVDPSNLVIIDTSAFAFFGLNFTSGDQMLRLGGKISADPDDTLTVTFRNLDISRADLLVAAGIDIDGILNGTVGVSGVYNKLALNSRIRVGGFSFNKELLGDADLDVTYHAEQSRFDVLAGIVYTGNVGQNIPFSLKGFFIMDEIQPGMEFDLTLKNLNLKMFGPFVSDFMTGLNGFVSGDVNIRGNPERPIMTGKLNMKRTEFRIAYLNVPYSFADVIVIDTNAFRFNNITLYDSLGHKATLDGAITHNNFSGMMLNLKATLQDFCAFNNTRAQNNIFYGKARGTGTVTISGPTDRIMIDVRARTGGNTHITIPIDLTESVGDNDFIVFVQKEGDSLMMARPGASAGTDLSLNLALQVTPEAEVEVYFPDRLGNLKANGSGNLLISMTPTIPFSMQGTFTLAKGSFVFTFRNLLRIPMAIHEGSNIIWSGDPADADVNIAASYRTKAPLAGLTSDPELTGIRFNVECILRLGGKLLNPDIRFGLKLPNVEESIKNIVYAAIDTTNASEMNQQMIYLMVANQFKPVVSGASATFDVGSTSMSLLTNQINSWLSGISKNVNLGVNYRPGTSSTTQEFDVNFSTQLLDDRLLIDGTFGMNSYNSAYLQQASTVVGDINVEYLLTKNRRWRIHAFNRTNTLSILNNNAPYTQGVGITYTRNFSNFRELFKGSTQEKNKKKNESKATDSASPADMAVPESPDHR